MTVRQGVNLYELRVFHVGGAGQAGMWVSHCPCPAPPCCSRKRATMISHWRRLATLDVCCRLLCVPLVTGRRPAAPITCRRPALQHCVPWCMPPRPVRLAACVGSVRLPATQPHHMQSLPLPHSSRTFISFMRCACSLMATTFLAPLSARHTHKGGAAGHQ